MTPRIAHPACNSQSPGKPWSILSNSTRTSASGRLARIWRPYGCRRIVTSHAGASDQEPGAGGGGGDNVFDFSLLNERITELKQSTRDEIRQNWRDGRASHHTVAAMDVWVRKLKLHGESIACGTHTGEVFLVDGLCGRDTETNLYPDPEVEVPHMTACRLRRYVGLDHEVSAIDFDGTHLLAGTKAGTLRSWRATTASFPQLPPGEPGKALQMLAGTAGDSVKFEGHSGLVSHCQLLGEGQAVSSSIEGSIHLWEQATGRRTHTVAVGTAVTAMAATESYIIAGLGDGQVAAWTNPGITEREPKLLLTFEAHPSPVTAMYLYKDAFFNQDVLVTGCEDGTLRSWDFQNGGKALQEFRGHSERVVSVRMDHLKLLSASKDGSVRCWDLRSGESLFGIYGHTAYIGSVDFDESRLVSDGTNNIIGLHDFGPGAPPHDEEMSM